MFPPFTPEPMKSALSRLPWPSNTPFPSRMSLRLRIGAQLDVSSIYPRAHEVRSIAASVAFQYSLSLKIVLEAAYWRSENPFINFYLRDFRAKRAEGTKGISFVAASVPVTFPRPARSGH
ncbi:hypothetical protein ACOMHN_026343 [Nucella lapillus]